MILLLLAVSTHSVQGHEILAPQSMSSLLPPPQIHNGRPAAEIILVDEPPQAIKKQYSPGYKLTLSGQLKQDLVISRKQSPVLIQGIFLIPRGRTLSLQAGVVVHIRPALTTQFKQKDPNAPDPEAVGQLWCLGKLLADGLHKKNITIQGAPDKPAEIFFYGSESSELRGTDLTWVSVTQNAGIVRWLGCQFSAAPHYALSSGAALFQHCDFKRFGGVLATYSNGPWGLMINHSRFDTCTNGIVLGNNPGVKSLIIEHNNFLNMPGPILKAWPIKTKTPKQKKRKWREFLVGENWYGTSAPEQIDASIHDYRKDRTINARINTRAPSEVPFTDTGSNVSAKILANTYHKLAPIKKTLIKAYLGSKALQKKWPRR